MKKTYLFYDLETTGLNKSFDQILQFAGIRTDENFNELERKEIIIRIRPDVIPSPGAMITHRIPISRTLSEGISEYEAIKKIHSMVNEPGTVSIGYNNLGFDDEFLRFAFYHNLLDPYTHQYKNDCLRIDLLTFATVFKLYREDIITWPELNGIPTLKLEHISSTNRFAEGQAHDAMVDVEATVNFAKALRKDEKLWDYIEAGFKKKNDIERVNKLPGIDQDKEFKFALMISSKFGMKANYSAPVVLLGQSNHYGNNLWLRLDLPELQETDFSDIGSTTYVIRKTVGGPEAVVPFVDKTKFFLGDERLKTTSSNIEWLNKNKKEFFDIVNYHKNYKYPEVNNVDLDSRLYLDGFRTKEENIEIQKFHNSKLEELPDVITKISSARVRDMAVRILIRNFNVENPMLELKKENYFNLVNPPEGELPAIDFKGDLKYTPADARTDIASLKENDKLDEQQLKLIDELEAYIDENFPTKKTQLNLF